MSLHIIAVIFFVFIIHFIETLAYSVRIVGIRTGKIAISLALFNLVVLVSRTANTIQAPLLAKTVENTINFGFDPSISRDFRMILLATTFAAIAGGFFIPTFQRIFTRVVRAFDVHRSVPKLLLHGFSKAGIRYFKDSIKVPSKDNMKHIKSFKNFPVRIFIFNVIAVAFLTVGVLSSLYAGILAPEFRTTSATLSAFVTSISTILMFVFIDPYLSIMTDDVIAGVRNEDEFRISIMFMVGSRILGTLLAQLLLFPAAKVIAFLSTNIL